MRKKIIMLVLAAASLAAFALPATAMAVEEDKPIHVVPKPEGEKVIDGEGFTTFTATFGNLKCTASSGKATFTSSTTGTLEQRYTGCSEPFGGKCTTTGQPEGTITTPTLEFHLVTVEDSTTHATGPGLLLTPNAGIFASFKCPVVGELNIGGNGLIGTITKITENGKGGTNPPCNEEGNEATIEFSSTATSGEQTHRTVVGTTTEYELKSGGQRASEDMSLLITLGTKTKLECT